MSTSAEGAMVYRIIVIDAVEEMARTVEMAKLAVDGFVAFCHVHQPTEADYDGVLEASNLARAKVRELVRIVRGEEAEAS